MAAWVSDFVELSHLTGSTTHAIHISAGLRQTGQSFILAAVTTGGLAAVCRWCRGAVTTGGWGMCTMCKYNVPGGRTAYGIIPVLELERQAPRAQRGRGGFLMSARPSIVRLAAGTRRRVKIPGHGSRSNTISSPFKTCKTENTNYKPSRKCRSMHYKV